MATLTDDDLAYLRTWLGSIVNADTNAAYVDSLQEIYDRRGTLLLVVVDTLRERLANIADPFNNPLSYNIAGEYSQDGSANVAFLTKLLSRAEQEAGVPGQSVMTSATPADDRWRHGYPRSRLYATDVERHPTHGYWYGR